MGYKLCTCEKPSVARDIAKVLCATKKEKGYIVGNGYIVTWCIGHLVTLAEPDAYGEEYKDKRNLALLPIIPNEWKYSIIEDVKEQFEIVKELMHRDDVDAIIDMGDAGDTGHYLQWLVRKEANCTKPVYRFLATSLTKEAILSAMNNLKNINEFSGIVKGASAKDKADYIIGMSFSRLYTSLYNTDLRVGRVISPTLYFVVLRYLEFKNFKPTPFFNIKATFINGIEAIMLTDNKNKIEDKNLSSDIIEKIKIEKQGKVIELNSSKKTTNRPLLYDITELERDGINYFGYTAAQVLKIAQSLYEKHKILSYPRTDSRYITSDLAPYMEIRINDIATLSEYQEISNALLNKGLLIDERIVKDEAVTDHHAIIVTENINNFDLSLLDEQEKNILHLVIARMLTSFSPKFAYTETRIIFQVGDYKFLTENKIPIFQGWKMTEKLLMGKNKEYNDTIEKNELIGNITINLGDFIEINSIELLSKMTQSPKLHTEATLLTAMENAGNSLKDNEFTGTLKDGIGTQATRAEIIKKLFDVGFVVKDKKNIIPTEKGLNLCKILPNELMSPKLTAEWESKIKEIQSGQKTEEQFLNEIKYFVTPLIEKEIKIGKREIDFENNIGKCPFCNSPIREGKNSFYCSNAKIGNENEGCRFILSKEHNYITKFYTGKNLTLLQMTELLSPDGLKITTKSQDGKKYKKVLKIKKTLSPEGFVQFEDALPKTKVDNKKLSKLLGLDLSKKGFKL